MPEEFAAFLKNQTGFWAKIVKSVGVTAEQQ
jgi:tripartite-type tricarboxylate transporter receptor subunit TctC